MGRAPFARLAPWSGLGSHAVACPKGRAVGAIHLPGTVGSGPGASDAVRLPGTVGRAIRVPCGRLARGSGSGLRSSPGSVARAQGLSGSRARWTGCSGARGCPRPAGRVRRRWDVAGGVGGGVGWRSADRQPGGPVASRPRARPGGGLGTARPDSPGRWGRHGASAADDGLRTRPRVECSWGRRSRRRGRPGRCVGRVGRPGWSGRPPAAGSGPHPGFGAAGSWRPGAGPPAHPAFSDHGSWVVPGRSGPGVGMVPGRWDRARGRGGGAGQGVGG